MTRSLFEEAMYVFGGYVDAQKEDTHMEKPEKPYQAGRVPHNPEMLEEIAEGVQPALTRLIDAILHEYEHIAANDKMPCGHHPRYAYVNNEGTGNCVMCALDDANARVQEYDLKFVDAHPDRLIEAVQYLVEAAKRIDDRDLRKAVTKVEYQLSVLGMRSQADGGTVTLQTVLAKIAGIEKRLTEIEND